MSSCKIIGKVTLLLEPFITVGTVGAGGHCITWITKSAAHWKYTDFVMSQTSVSNPLYIVSIIYGHTLVMYTLF